MNAVFFDVMNWSSLDCPSSSAPISAVIFVAYLASIYHQPLTVMMWGLIKKPFTYVMLREKLVFTANFDVLIINVLK